MGLWFLIEETLVTNNRNAPKCAFVEYQQTGKNSFSLHIQNQDKM